MKKPASIALLATLFVANLVLLAPQSLGLYKKSAFGQLNLLFDIRHELVTGYVEKPDQEKMILAAVRGMIDSLGDQHTTYFTKEELGFFDRDTMGTFSGIGAEVTIDPTLRRLKIITPLEDSPAWKSGVMAGDIVMSIDGEDTLDMKIDAAVKRLIGKAGTDVVISVRHESGDEEDITITRAVINVQSVRGLIRDDDQHWRYIIDEENEIGYVRLSQFSENTAADLRERIEDLEEEGVRGLIIDLRFNGGGLLDSAVEISDMFLDKGKRIVSVKGRVMPEEVFDATDDQIAKDLHIVVLANEFSASASEILTGALHDNNRAKFIGTRTFGKGSVQQMRALPNDEGALKMTNAYYYLPNGEKIHRTPDSKQWGVNPGDGFFVAMNADQILEMHKLRRDREIIRAEGNGDNGDKITPQWIEQKLADPQLAAGLRAMVGKIKTGDWPAVGQSGETELVRQFQRENLVRRRDALKERLDEVKEMLTKLDAGEEVDVDKLSANAAEQDEGAVPAMDNTAVEPAAP